MRAALPRAVLVLAAAIAAAAAPLPTVTLVGRFSPGPGADGTATLPQLMTWSASSVSLSFTGSPSVEVQIDTRPEALPQPSHGLLDKLLRSPQCRFTFQLDGEAAESADTDSSKPVLTWRRAGLDPAQRHNLTVTKITEARQGTALLRSVELGDGGTFLPPPPSPGQQTGRRILVLGDSYAAGAGNTGDAGCVNQPNAITQDSSKAWGPLVAAHFGADIQLLAWSGGGVNVPETVTPAGHTYTADEQPVCSPLSRQLFPRADAMDPSSQYDLRSWAPQVAFLAGGTNDFRDASLDAEKKVRSPNWTSAQWLQQYEDLVWQVRRAYPQAAIVLVAWPLEQNLVGVRNTMTQLIYLQHMALAYSRVERAGNVHFLQLDGSGFSTSTNWCFAHPDGPTHANVEQQVVDWIDGALPGFAASPAAAVPRLADGVISGNATCACNATMPAL